MAGGHDGWIHQGRQYHQWFGHGTKPKDDRAKLGPLETRIQTLAATLVASLPASKRYHAATRPGTSDHAAFARVMHGMARSYSASPGLFAAHFFDSPADRPYAQDLQKAARLTATASTRADMRDASDSLAKAVLAIGLDRWLPFIRDADERIRDRDVPVVVPARAGPEPSVRPAPASPRPPPAIGPVAAAIAAASALLALYDRAQAEAAVRKAGGQFDLDLGRPADLKAAIAHAFVMRAGARVLAALGISTPDRNLAAQAVMEAVRDRPDLLGCRT